ncbi:hypothetical protein T02_1924 [Trichinella nativa]|uniref:Uncharacterized protein n=2 Tax=Trichinella TaxID=6333 RepID=A0A0V1KU41_9BILA|nr:hypothetical protein T05_11788 [Trichinella murrelli]KRZ50877.1 hypothetical protein T02_1924 [Trichinella nativa]KRZ88068.1 hypothetical protein T08_7542 [Trichinella sp. T8]
MSSFRVVVGAIGFINNPAMHDHISTGNIAGRLPPPRRLLRPTLCKLVMIMYHYNLLVLIQSKVNKVQKD